MKAFAYIYSFTLSIQILSAQPDINKSLIAVKLDSTYLLIDNSLRSWFTLELKTDTLFQIDSILFFYANRTLQLNSLPFNNGKPEGVMGSATAELNVLREHKKWELDYQKKTLKSTLQNGEEKFYNKNGKQFLIWWFANPAKSKIPERTIDVYTSKFPTNSNGKPVYELNVTHMLFLDFIVQGNTIVTVCIPVFESEKLEDEINSIKTIANTLNVYGYFIDLETLFSRLDNNKNYVFRDSLSLIEVELPSWLNVIKSPFDKSIMATFPEKDNIINSVGIVWRYKTDTTRFNNFSKNIQNKSSRDYLKVLCDSVNIKREFFTKDNSRFYCQNIYMQSEKLDCFINFTATPTTYEFNIGRLNELITKIKLK
jgi:hypothetical protein